MLSFEGEDEFKIDDLVQDWRGKIWLTMFCPANTWSVEGAVPNRAVYGGWERCDS